MAQSLEDLGPFFSKPEAKAIIVTDMKMDDALCLWYFFKLNFSRPAGHKVDIKIFVIGIKDLAGAVALANHIFSEAKKGAAQSRSNASSVKIKFEVLASGRTGPTAAMRHEADTYAPYNNKTPGFPQANKDKMKFFQDLDAKSLAGDADFIGVICQYFSWGVLGEKHGKQLPTFDADLLDYIVPKAGGMLAFQMGFNTRLCGSEEEQRAFWDALSAKLKTAGAKTAFISNAFSFAKSEKKSGTIDPETEPFVASLKKQSPKLWDHLFFAGRMDSIAFACDQMAKWVTGFDPQGMDAPAKVTEEADRCRSSLELGDSKDRDEISKKLKGVIGTGPEGVQKVLKSCTDLHDVAKEACGEHVADYLGRAVKGLANFGRSLEITDGQQLMALFQSKVPVLHPVKSMEWVEGVKCLGPSFGEGDGVMWAAKDIDVQQNLDWMEKGLRVPSCYGLTLGKNSPTEMRVTTKKPGKFYVSSALALLKGVEKEGGERLPPLDVLHISGLGGAVNVACIVAAGVEEDGAGRIESIKTDYVDPNQADGTGVRAQPQIKIVIRRATS